MLVYQKNVLSDILKSAERLKCSIDYLTTPTGESAVVVWADYFTLHFTNMAVMANASHWSVSWGIISELNEHLTLKRDSYLATSSASCSNSHQSGGSCQFLVLSVAQKTPDMDVNWSCTVWNNSNKNIISFMHYFNVILPQLMCKIRHFSQLSRSILHFGL